MVTNRNIAFVIRTLKRAVRAWAVPVVGHYKADPFTTLISCLLSLRTRDQTTHAASKRLFALASDPMAMAKLSREALERAIYPVAFYRVKAASIQKLCGILIEKHAAKVPDTLEALLTLPGVGRKTANLVVTLAFDKPGICVDTHVHRISNRWGYIRARTPDETEMALRKKLPGRYWKIYNDLLVAFGQNLCQPVSPWCSRCPLSRVCPRKGVRHAR